MFPTERLRRLVPSGTALRLRLRLRALPRPGLPRSRRAQRRLVQTAMVASVLALAPTTWMHLVADDRITTVAEVPKQDVAVVFGAGLRDGEPTRYLAHRLDAAVDLYRAGKVKVVLVTGDNSRVEYDEPDAMRTYLTARGVPDGHVVSDYAGFDTWDSCVRAKKVFGVDRAVLVTQDFHIRRAVTLCRSAGVESYGIGVTERLDSSWYHGKAREVFAAGKGALDVLLEPDPRFLGAKEKGVQEALVANGG